MSPNSLTWDDTDLISRVRCGSCFSNATDIASGLSAGLASGLGWSLTTRQLLLVHNIANTDWGWCIHHFFDVGWDRVAGLYMTGSLLALTHINVVGILLWKNTSSFFISQHLNWRVGMCLSLFLLDHTDWSRVLLPYINTISIFEFYLPCLPGALFAAPAVVWGREPNIAYCCWSWLMPLWCCYWRPLLCMALLASDTI